MSNDLQAQVTADTGPAVTSVNKLTTAVNHLENKTKDATKAAQDYQKKVNGGFKEASAGVARAGGPLGSIGGRVLGGLGMGGGLGLASVALASLTTAFTALSAASDRAVAQVGRQIEQEDKLREARAKGEQDVEAQAKAGAGQEGALRPLIAKGGAEAERALIRLENQGIDTPTAARGIEAVIKRFPGQPLDSGAAKNAIDQAVNLESLGIRFDEAIEKLLARGGLNTFDGAMRSGDLVYKEFTGQRGDPAELRNQAITNVASSEYLTNVQEAQRIQGALPASQRGRSGDLQTTAREDLAAAVDPMSKSLLEANVLATRQIAALERMANEQSALVRWLRTAGRTYGLSEGSERQKLNDAIMAREAALFAPER